MNDRSSLRPVIAEMKRFLRRLSAFCLILVPVLFLADYVLSAYMRKVNTFGMETWRDIMEGKAGADMVIMGNSRAFNSCDREVLDSLTGQSSYNLASIGNLSTIQFLRYEMYREHNSKPRTVVMFTDDVLLGAEISQYDPVQYFPWMWDRSFSRAFVSLRKHLYLTQEEIILESLIPYVRYYGSRPWNLDRHHRLTHDGFYSFDVDTFNMTGGEKKRFIYLEDRDKAFRDFIQGNLDEGIRVVLVCPPFHESVVFEDNERERMVQYYTDVADDFGIPFYNCLSMDIVHDTTFFLDSDHLNAKGAKVFTDSLSHYLVGLGLFEN